MGTICTFFCLLNFFVYATAADSTEIDSMQQDTTLSLIDSIDTEEKEEEELPPIEKMPELLKHAEPEYPSEIYKKGIQGTVRAELIINEKGRVDSAYIIEGVHPVLDSNVIKVAKEFIFTPAIAGGEAVPVLIQYEKFFTIQEIVEKIEKYVNFKGMLIERGTKKPISDAMVVLEFTDTLYDKTLDVPFKDYLDRISGFEGQYLEENKLVTLSDSLGNFFFYSIPCGKIKVSIPIAGYEEFTVRENINKNEELEIKYYLRRMSYSEYEVVAYGKKEKKEVTRRKLTLREVKRIPGFGGDAVKVVQALPGVARPTLGMSQIVVRGANTSDSKFFLDGIEIPLLFHYGLKSTYNSDALESVDFYPGGFGTRYGDVTAGVIEITARKPKTDRWYGYGDASFIDASFMAEGPVNKKVSLLFSGRRSFVGDIIKLAARNVESATIMTIAPFYWDYIARADFNINSNHHSYLTLFGVKDKMEMVTSEVRGGSEEIDEAKDMFKVEILFHLGILGWDWTISDMWKNSFKYSITYAESNWSIFGFAKQEMTTWQHYLRDVITFSPGKKIDWKLGLDMKLWPTDIDLRMSAGEGLVIKLKKEDWMLGIVGGYLNCEWRPINGLKIIPGLRYDYYPPLIYDGAVVPEFWNYKNNDLTSGYSAEPSFRFATRYEFRKNHTVKASTGNYSQQPQPIGWAIDSTWGNPSLGVTRAAQYTLGYEWQITDLLYLDLEGYFNRQWDVPRTITGDPHFVADNKKRMKGIELMLRHDQSEKFFGWLAYSLSKAEQYNFGDKKYIPTDKDQTHNLIVVGNWRLPKSWEVGFKLQFTTGDPKTPVIGEIETEHLHYKKLVYGKTNSERLSPTFQIDLRIDKKIIFKKSILSAYVDFFNIGYFMYKSVQFYNINFEDPYNEKEGKPNETPVAQYSIPSIGLKWEF